MKGNRLFKILAVAVILALLMVAVPATTVLGAGTISLSASTGPPGELITVTASSAFPANTSGYVWFDEDGDASMDTGENYRAVATDATGDFTSTISLTIPTVPQGGYYVYASIGADTDYASFTITPEISISPTSGNVGDTVTVDGVGFDASSELTVSFGGDEVTITGGDDETDAYGSFEDLTFTVPASTEGIHAVEVEDEGSNDDSLNFTVSPEITLSASSGAVGDTLTVSGTGFDGSSEIDIYFDTSIVGSADTNANGSFSATSFSVPSTSRGSHTVKARDEGSNQDTATFSVGQKITINPTSGTAGTSVTITGTGFAASSTITITYNSLGVSTNPSSVTSNSAGYFTATFSVPAGLAGTYVVQASDASSNTSTANFTSTTDATIAPVTSATDPGYVGMEVTITGLGFTPSGTATITYDDTETLATEDIDTSGSFTATFNIPASLSGVEHIITVSDNSGVTKTFTFVMESAAPPTPVITLPLADTKLKDDLFDWEASTDAEGSNPVSYDLQVATDEAFTEPVLLYKVGLTEDSYTLLEEEELESLDDDAPYYWRVRALDAASNASAWSTATPFTVGWSFEFTGWVIWVTMVLVAAAFFFLGLWIGRRGGGGGYY